MMTFRRCFIIWYIDKVLLHYIISWITWKVIIWYHGVTHYIKSGLAQMLMISYNDFVEISRYHIMILSCHAIIWWLFGNSLGEHRIWNFQIRPEPDLDKNSGRICRIWHKPVMGTIGDKSVFKMAVYVFYYF
jgi:hypothetical protein